MLAPFGGSAGEGAGNVVEIYRRAIPTLVENWAFYRDWLGHELLWPNEALGQVGWAIRDAATEIELVTGEVGYEPR
jgi:hypothetical protein